MNKHRFVYFAKDFENAKMVPANVGEKPPDVLEAKPSRIKDIDDTNFESEILNGKGLSAVFFYAPWDKSSIAMAPMVEKLSGHYNMFHFARLDTDNSPKAAGLCDVRAVPAVLIFKEGKIVGKVLGFQPYSSLESKLKNLL